jgi:hypothetical protein
VTWPAKAGSGRPTAGRMRDCSVEFRSSKFRCGSQVWMHACSKALLKI